MIEVSENGGIMITGEDINVFQFLARKSALKLEIAGLRHSGGSVYAVCKKVYRLKGSKQRVLEQMEVMYKQMLEAREQSQQ